MRTARSGSVEQYKPHLRYLPMNLDDFHKNREFIGGDCIWAGGQPK